MSNAVIHFSTGCVGADLQAACGRCTGWLCARDGLHSDVSVPLIAIGCFAEIYVCSAGSGFSGREASNRSFGGRVRRMASTRRV